MMNDMKQLKTPLITGNSVSDKRAELKQYFCNTWQTYESLFSLINADEAYYLRPEPLRHPLIFYFGHTASFYINKLILGKFINHRINHKLEAICAVGVDEMSWDDLNSEHYDWPQVNEVITYRTKVFELVDDLIDTMELVLPIKQDSLAWIILMGCEHERIHLETSSVIMRMLPLNYLKQSEAWQGCSFHGDAPTNQFLPVGGQSLTLGKPIGAATFGWDNEYGETKVEVNDFLASKYLVSNQEFLAFVEAGGYQTTVYWTEEGQNWLNFSKATMPHFWRKNAAVQSISGDLLNHASYFQRNLLVEIPLPLNWPVEVNYLEAKAFCNWKSQQSSCYIRLPTEAEWLCLRNTLNEDLVSWQEAPGNINLEFFASPCPVNRFDTEGFFDVLGNVWQWTESAIDGFNGFEVHPLYDDFSTPTFDGRHNLIKGGSWISTGNEAIKDSRYAFRRHFFQHAGFRTIQTDYEEIPVIDVNPYESDKLVCQQLESHYGQTYLSTPNYQQSIAKAVIRYTQRYQIPHHKVLDLGCSVGRGSFELAHHFLQVDGIDSSARFIQYGVQLQQGKSVRYLNENEGDIVDFKEIAFSMIDGDEGIQSTKGANKVSFFQGDACNLKVLFSGYDVVLVQHVVEQSYNPSLFLKNIDQRLNPKGLLIIISDYRFDKQKTDKTKWLSGVKVNGENVNGLDGLSLCLSNKFTLLDQQEITRVLKENGRNFKVSNSQLTVWQLK